MGNLLKNFGLRIELTLSSRVLSVFVFFDLVLDVLDYGWIYELEFED